jgi:hypothetical protein
MNPQLSTLLKWSIENTPTDTTNPPPPTPRPIDTTLLRTLFSGPSDAELMRASLAAATDPTTPLATKLTALDNLEQLIEALDNANQLAPLGLWAPLAELLGARAAAVRRIAAWCVGTAVQNNRATQEAALAAGIVAPLLRLVRGEGDWGVEEAVAEDAGPDAVRRKAVYALSSLVRNFQPGADAVVAAVGGEGVDAADMEAVDGLLERLRGGG